MNQEKISRIYERLEKALTEETCTYEEAESAVDKLRENCLNRKADAFLKRTTLQEIVSTELEPQKKQVLVYKEGRPNFESMEK